MCVIMLETGWTEWDIYERVSPGMIERLVFTMEVRAGQGGGGGGSPAASHRNAAMQAFDRLGA